MATPAFFFARDFPCALAGRSRSSCGRRALRFGTSRCDAIASSLAAARGGSIWNSYFFARPAVSNLYAVSDIFDGYLTPAQGCFFAEAASSSTDHAALAAPARIRTQRVEPMWDLIVVAIAIVSFGLFYAYTLGCDRL